MKENNVISNDLIRALDSLFHNIMNKSYSGYDPYDGLNSRLFKWLLLDRVPLFRLVWIQLFKRNPFNLRRLALIPKSFNPKAGALFLSGYVRLFKKTNESRYKEEANKLAKRLVSLAIPTNGGLGYGYDFSWQAKAFYVPLGTPNLITTVYVGNALLDYVELFPCKEIDEIIPQIKSFMLSEMIYLQTDKKLCFSYIPGDNTEVHNVNLLGAAFLSRVNKLNNDSRITEIVRKAIRFSIADIKNDGFWSYGTKPYHRWMDNFHTGFNLEALLDIRENLNETIYDDVIKKVYTYYISNMYADDGTPKYYPHQTYPIDIHTIAVSLIVLNRVIRHDGDLFDDDEKDFACSLVGKIIVILMNDFWTDRGYFYYQKHKYWMNKIPYMRWSQAWMFYALSKMPNILK